MRTSAIIPAALMDAANERLEFDANGDPTGFGPNNFSVALGSNDTDVTHAALSCGDVTGFVELLLEMQASGDFAGLVVEYAGKPVADGEPPNRGDFKETVTAQALTKWDGIVENLPMKGDERTFQGKTWVSTMDYNVWDPGVSGWREVVAEGYPAWVQPAGAHDAYARGDRVTYQGADYESAIDANVWSPTGYPAGWTAL